MKLVADQAYAQVQELLSNYGKVDILWFDGCNPNDPLRWRSQQILDMARKLQPEILINDRAALPGDFSTPENVVAGTTQTLGIVLLHEQDMGVMPVMTAIINLFTKSYDCLHHVLRKTVIFC